MSKACSVTKGEREEHLNRAGIVDQDRRTRTDVELCRQHHIRCTTPLEEFFARAALAQRMVQLRLHGPKGGQGRQGFWRPPAVEMTDDGAGTDEVFKGWPQTAVVLPPFARREHRDLAAIRPCDRCDGPRVAPTACQDGGGLRGSRQGGAIR